MLAISRCFSGSMAAKPRLDVLPPLLLLRELLEEPLLRELLEEPLLRELLEELLRELPEELPELALMPDLLPELFSLSELSLDCEVIIILLVNILF